MKLAPVSVRLSWWQRHRRRVIVLSCGFIVFAAANFLGLESRAGIAKFYPATCLGGWESPERASGAPDELSAVLKPDTLAEIFCGEFKGEIPDDSEPKNFQLKLTWQLKYLSRDRVTTATTSLIGDDFAEQAGIILDTPTDADSPVELTISDDLNATSTATSTTPESELPTTPADSPNSDLPDPITPENSPNQENQQTPENTTPEVITPPEAAPSPTDASQPASENVSPPVSESPTSWWRGLINIAWATTTVAENISSPQIASEVLAAGEQIAAENQDLEVLYTLDSQTWQTLGKVGESNWREASFTLPITNWSDLSKLQISIKRLSTLDEPPRIELDSLELAVFYESPFETEITPQEISFLPRVTAPENTLLLAPTSDFSANETPSFEINPDLVSELVADLQATTTRDSLIATSSLEAATSTDLQLPVTNPEETATTTLINLPELDLEKLVPEKLLNWLQSPRLIQPAFAATPSQKLRVLKTEILDATGKLTDLKAVTTETESGEQIEISVEKTAKAFRPGRYRLRVELLQARRVIVTESDFTWGVLALNANKSIYAPNERGYLQFAALDDTGHTICDADLALKISGPDNLQAFLSTKTGEIIRSDTCGANNVTDEPDYFAYYFFSQTGSYKLTLTDLKNNHEIRDEILVRSGDNLVIERISATRINPFKADYVMKLRVTAHTNFSGSLIETLPGELTVTSGESAWPLSLAAGETREFAYTYHAPPVSPQIYLLGPAKIRQGEQEIFTEAREWQVAADNACQSNGTGGGNWNTAGTWTSCGGTVPQAADTVTIVNGDTVTLDVDSAITSITINNGGILTTDNGSRNLTLTPAAAGTAWTIGSTATFTPGNSTVKITSDAAITGVNGTTTFNNFQLVPTITAARTYTLQANAFSPITVNGDFLINATKATTAARLTVNMGSSITGANTSTITIKGTTVGQATLTTTSSNYAITTGFVIIDDRGTFTLNDSTVTLTGTSGTLLTRTGTTVGVLVRGTSTIVVTSDATVAITSGTFGPSANSLNNLTLSPTITDNRTYTLNTAAMTIAGDFTINPTAASAKTLTVNLGGALTVSTSKTITISGTTSGLSTLDTTSSNHAITTGLINIASAGTFTANGSTITLGATSGTLFTRSGTFNANTSTVKYTGDGTTVTLTSGTFTSTNAFYNLQVVPVATGLVFSPRTYTFGSGAITVGNTFDVNPTSIETGAIALNVVLGAALTVNATTTLTNTPIDGVYYATSTLNTGSDYALTTGSLVMSHASSTLKGNASTITVNNNFWKTAGTFTPNTSTVTFTTATSSTINLGGTGTGNQFYNLTINKSSTATTTLITNHADVTNNLVISAGILDLGGKNIVTTTNFSNSGTLRLQGSETVSFSTNDTDSGTWEYYGDGTGAATTQTVKDFGNTDYYALKIYDTSASNQDTFRTSATLNASSTVTVASSTLDISTNSNLLILDGILTISGGTLTATNGTIDANSDVFITSGTLTGPAGNFNVAGNWTRYGGTFTHNSGTVTFDTSSTPSIETNTDETFYNLIISKSGGSFTLLNSVNVANDFTQSAGTFDITDTGLTVAGNLALQGGILEAIGSNTTDIDGNLTISSGTFSAPAGSMTVGGSYNNSGGTFTANSGTVTFDATAGGKTLAGTMTGTSAFYNLTFDGSGGAWAFSNNASTTNAFTYTLGTVTAPALLSVAGNWTRNGGTFTHNSGTVELTGTNQTITGATTFYNLKKVDTSNNSTDPILTFSSNATTTISGLVTFVGLDSNDRVDLRASTWGTRWGFTVNGTYNINYASTTDSDASLGSLIFPNNTTDGGNNLNWDFGSLTISLDGATEAFSSLTPGTLVATSSIITIRSANLTGFSLAVRRSNATATMRLTTNTALTIPDKTNWSPGLATTSAGNATASTTEPLTLQFRVKQSGTDTPNYASAWWGTDDTTVNALFAGLPSSDTEIANRSTSALATTTLSVLYNLNVPSTQPSGDYSGDVVYTVTANP
ncbi:MAG: hypothetical protein AAB364_01840 [Patescibacteria group bacterium]